MASRKQSPIKTVNEATARQSQTMKNTRAKKSIKRLEAEVAEKRGYTMCLKELAMEEATAMEGAIQLMEAKLARMKRNNEIKLVENECIEQFIACMLVIFQAEDELLI